MNTRDLDRTLARFVEGDLSPAETRDLVRFLKDHPGHESRLLQDLDFISTLQTTLGKSDQAFADEVMEATARIRVEDADGSAAWQQGEASAQPEKRNRQALPYWRTAIMALAASVLAVAGVWWWSEREGHVSSIEGGVVAKVAEVRGECRRLFPSALDTLARRRPGLTGTEAARPLKPGDEVWAGDRLEVAAGGRLVLACRDGHATITAGTGKRRTRLALSGDGAGHRLSLDLGRLAATVKPQRDRRMLMVETPHARAQVLGTEFSLGVSENRSRLVVDEGRVALAPAAEGKGVVVAAGQYCDVGPLASGENAGTNRLTVLPKEALGWQPGRVLWSTDFESETTNRRWVAYVIRADPATERPTAQRIETDANRILRFARLRVGDRDSTVMVMDGRGLNSPASLALVQPEVQAIMAGGTFLLEYDEYVRAQSRRDGDTGSGKAADGTWRHMASYVARTSSGATGRECEDGRVVRIGHCDPRTFDWLMKFVFCNVRTERTVDNVVVRELVRGVVDLDPD